MGAAKSRFSDGFLDKTRQSSLYARVYDMVEIGHDPYNIIENLCHSVERSEKQLMDLIQNGPRPQIIITTQENIDKYLNEKKG